MGVGKVVGLLFSMNALVIAVNGAIGALSNGKQCFILMHIKDLRRKVHHVGSKKVASVRAPVVFGIQEMLLLPEKRYIFLTQKHCFLSCSSSGVYLREAWTFPER